MRNITKAVLAAIALAGAATAMSAPAKAAVGFSVGVTGGDPSYGGYYESDPYAEPYYDPSAAPYDPYAAPYDQYAADPYAADPYACDYYDPPWGYPPDYCRYQVWYEPVYVGGLWYNGPIYYRNYSGLNWFWLNGGWRRDEWRGPRPNWDRRYGNQYGYGNQGGRW